jgi:hypothetical protein
LAQRARIALLAAEVPPNAEIARRVVTRQTVISWRGGPCVRRRIGGPVRADDVNVEEWVREVFAPVFSRSIGGPVKWCAQWWAHGEAVLRLEALWRSWEIHRLDPGRRMATWLRDFADNSRRSSPVARSAPAPPTVTCRWQRCRSPQPPDPAD